ncbi:PQQ-dependent sugar dehydrogenase [Aureibacillus halotolerans]|uniref:Glucose/arabinose dehydrogenase n=1 Tax=Aureibacillus halotolerans TaxID=1508390 RepID=A0A4R6TWW3_9BACI|nr:PQQ-dependent sugar dehydrogenase [Aureibacillus halotolerans]TDQ36763.1 glucose/arabinose dehydrogenase [Aureibacillus halotolerans]
MKNVLGAILPIAITSIFLAACQTNEPPEPTPEPEEDVQQETESEDETSQLISQEERIAEELNVPWTIARAQNGFYITQRNGELLFVQENGEKTPQTVNLATPVTQQSESGLLGFVLDPDFESNRLAYLYHTYEVDGELRNRLISVTENEGAWEETAVLLDNIPASPIHNGGRLAFGPHGLLYVTTGDAGNEELPQDKESLAGKILRLHKDGTVPEDNPFPDSYVYSYGHRNPQGITWLEDGTMYATEHGSSAQDEINEIEPGGNYGWPTIRGDESAEGMRQPIIHSGETTWAPSGLDSIDGTLYFAGLRGEGVFAYTPGKNEVTPIVSNQGRIRDVYIEDRILYFVTNNRDGRGTPSSSDDRLLSVPLE